jgi:hypothetical protein
MFRRHRLILLVAAWALSAAVPAATPQKALDLIPEDAAVGLVVKDLASLRDKGDKLYADNQITERRMPRPSAFFTDAFKHLKIEKGLDKNGSAALILPNFRKVGIKDLDLKMANFNDVITVVTNLVFVIPVSDADAMGSNFGLKAGTLKPGKMRTVEGKFIDPWYVKLQGKHLLLGFREEAVNAVAGGKPVRGAWNPAQAAALAKADIVLHFGPEACGPLWPGLLRLVKEGMTLPEEADNAVVTQFVQTLEKVRFAVVGLRLDDGLHLDFIASFPKGEGAEATKFLSALRGGPGASDLLGLPDRDPLIAYAAKGDGERNVTLARALFKNILDKWLGITVAMEPADRKKFWAAFETMYRHLKGSRAIIYRTDKDQAEKVGAVAGVAILDVDAPEVHRKGWTTLAEVANEAAPKVVREGRESSPHFTFKPGAETLDGASVDLLTMDIPGLKPDVARDYRRLLGPDWNKVRMVVQGKQVVWLVGSDVEALRQTLRNLKAGDKGLAGHKAVVTALDQLAPERKVELHINLKNYIPFSERGVERAGRPAPVEALSSIALTVETDRVQWEVRVPKAEIKSLVHALELDRE